MRGKGQSGGRGLPGVGITPACAGKSTHQPPSGRGTRGHPRVCGEKCGYRLPFSEHRGITPDCPPGKVAGNLEQGRVVGITPACAGKRIKLRKRYSICGEKLSTTSTDIHPAGSPPRVRGKGQGQGDGCDHQGITPACAGKRADYTGKTPKVEDHPRVCGEKSTSTSMMNCGWGSPPRVRGKAHCKTSCAVVDGITPAYAGKSSIQHLTASLGEFEVQKGHPVPHLRQRLQVWPDHARHLRHGLILHASRSAGQGRRLCPGPCPDTAGSGTPRGPSPAKRPHTSPPAATPGGCRAWQSGATAPGSR